MDLSSTLKGSELFILCASHLKTGFSNSCSPQSLGPNRQWLTVVSSHSHFDSYSMSHTVWIILYVGQYDCQYHDRQKVSNFEKKFRSHLKESCLLVSFRLPTCHFYQHNQIVLNQLRSINQNLTFENKHLKSSFVVN